MRRGDADPALRQRAQLTPSGRGKPLPSNATEDKPPEPADPRTPDERRRSMTWAQRLKRVFGIDVNAGVHCGGAARIVASVEEPHAIRAILAHFESNAALSHAHYRPQPRRAALGPLSGIGEKWPQTVAW